MHSTLRFITALFLLFCFISCTEDESLPEIVDPPVIVDPSTVTDYDGNVYRTVRIGDQVWMAENLRVTHYSDGSPVESHIYNDEPANLETYGRLYSWSAAMRNGSGTNSNPGTVQGISPSGWHIPSAAEWQQLVDYLGGEDVAGGKLKLTGTEFWNAPNSGATDEIGFGALPAGWYDFTGQFNGLGLGCFFRTSTAQDQYEVYIYELSAGSASASMGGIHPDDAVPIRCIKD